MRCAEPALAVCLFGLLLSVAGCSNATYQSDCNSGCGPMGFDGTVLSVAFDVATGEAYVGGQFQHYGGQAAPYLARLNFAYSSDQSFVQGGGFDGQVWAVQVAQEPGQTAIWVGGDFQHYNGTTVSYLARLTTAGQLDPIGATLDGPVHYLAWDGAANASSGIYAGGQFTTRLARFLTFGASPSVDSAFAPPLSSSDTVTALTSDPSSAVYVAVASATGTQVQYLDHTGAGISPGFSALFQNGNVYAIVENGTSLWAAGNFTTYNTASTGGLVEFPISTPSAAVSAPAGTTATALAFDGTNIYIVEQDGTAEVFGSGLATPRVLGAFNGQVNTIALATSWSRILFGGNFWMYDGGQVTRNYVQIDASSGAVR